MIKFCTNCGSEIPEEGKFCFNCGSKKFYPEKDSNDNATFCPNCGNQIINDLEYCPYCCGKVSEFIIDEQNRLFCSNCGYKNSSEWNFCSECGEVLVKLEEPAAEIKKVEDKRKSKSPSQKSKTVPVDSMKSQKPEKSPEPDEVKPRKQGKAIKWVVLIIIFAIICPGAYFAYNKFIKTTSNEELAVLVISPSSEIGIDKVIVNNEEKCKNVKSKTRITVPANIDLNINVKSEGFKDFVIQKKIAPGESVTIEPQFAFGRLKFEFDSLGLKNGVIYINDSKKGSIQQNNEIVLAPGSYDIKVLLSGYNEVIKSVTINEGETKYFEYLPEPKTSGFLVINNPGLIPATISIDEEGEWIARPPQEEVYEEGDTDKYGQGVLDPGQGEELPAVFHHRTR